MPEYNKTFMSENLSLKQLSESLGKPEHVIEYWIRHKHIISVKKEKGRLMFTHNEVTKLRKHFEDRENNKASVKKRQTDIIAKTTNAWKDKNATVNLAVIGQRQYDTHHVAKFDKEFKLIGFYKNRNQAVIDHFKKKGLGNTSIVIRYLRYNRTLRNTMERGSSWFGHYYVYVPVENDRTFLYNNENKYGRGPAIPVIAVHKNGKEQLFESKKVLTQYLGVSYVTVCHHADTGKLFSDKQVRVYTAGKRKQFNSVKDVVKFYGISKNITRPQIEHMAKTGKTIRGHKVRLKQYYE